MQSDLTLMSFMDIETKIKNIKDNIQRSTKALSRYEEDHGVWYSSPMSSVHSNASSFRLSMFNLEPAEDWRGSLRECGL